MLHRHSLLLLATLALTAAPLSQAAAQSCDDLAKTLDPLTTKGKLAKSKVGVHVVDLDSGKVLYAKNANKPMNPASNVKLLTSAAALHFLGPNHTFYTDIYGPSTPEKNVVDGSLYLTGSGEGFLLHKNFQAWANELKNLGITTIKGDIVVSDSGFAHKGNYLPPGFDQKPEDGAYRAAVSAVSVNFSAVTIKISPGKVGKPAKVSIFPPNSITTVVNKSKTTKGKKNRISLKSKPAQKGDKTQIIIQGSLGVSGPTFERKKRIDHPSLFAGSVFWHTLKEAGIKVEGDVRIGDVPKGYVRLLHHDSEPLVELLSALNKWSNNFMAEQVLRNLSMTKLAGDKKGTWAGGKAVVQSFLDTAGLNKLGQVSLLNGSGLYTGNLVSPAQFTQLLTYMHNHKWGSQFAKTLAIGGVDGSLNGRFKPLKGRVIGKTGTLNQVTALSGYVTTEGGKKLAISILINDPPVRAWRLRGAQDAIATAIASCK